jgi:pimeloyl-ACP methyl ester carboxylesterase
MNDIRELKSFAAVHAKLQAIDDELWQQVLGRIHDDGPDTAGSWVYEWGVAARAMAGAGDLLGATHCYIMARFPYVDGPARQAAAERAVSTFDAWRKSVGTIERVEGPGFSCWAAGLSTEAQRPLLVFSGGIVSVKEQWVPLLMVGGRLGLTVLVTEMPGVGENRLPYGPDSWQSFSAYIDAVAEFADVDQTYVIANSFSGHLALRAATRDRRIRGIISNAAPVANFFTDERWLRQLPRITVDTLVHLTGRQEAELPEYLRGWELTPEELSSLDIPVAYAGSLRDEITPPSELEYLRTHVRKLYTREFDDVHGSPAYVEENRMWFISMLMEMRK